MPAPLIIFIVLFAVTGDLTVHLFKKLECGNWATKFTILSSDAKVGIFGCVMCCVPLSLFLSFASFRFSGLENTFYLAVLLFFFYAPYRSLMLLSDRGASKTTSRHAPRMKQDKQVRRYYSLVFALFSVALSLFALFFIREINFAFF